MSSRSSPRGRRTSCLTLRELLAIEEALLARLAGEIDIENEPGAPRREDYDSAADKIAAQLATRKRVHGS